MEHYKELQQTKIFKDASEFECQAMMFCFKTKFKTFLKNEKIVNQGDNLEYVLLLLKGSAIVEHIDHLGNINVVTKLNTGDIYAAESAYVGDLCYKDNVIATEKTLVLFMDKHRLINQCGNNCKRHEFVIKNLMKMVAESNNRLLNKLSHLSKKTTRDKLLSYFSTMSAEANSTYFEIPFNKTELANYLSVDRSNMSTELAKLKKEGILDYDKKQYHIKLDKRG